MFGWRGGVDFGLLLEGFGFSGRFGFGSGLAFTELPMELTGRDTSGSIGLLDCSGWDGVLG